MIIKSYFWLLIGVLTLGAAMESWINGNHKLAMVSLAYAIADLVLCTIGE